MQVAVAAEDTPRGVRSALPAVPLPAAAAEMF